MKRLFNGWMMLGVWVALTILASCSEKTLDENDEQNTSETPDASTDEHPYAKYAVRYELTEGHEIASIELLADGSYMILPPEESSSYTAAGATRSESMPQFGSYELADDGSFLLKQFGTIKQIGEDQLEIVRENGSKSVYYSVRVFRAGEAHDPLSLRLCGIWHLVEVRVDALGIRYSTEAELKEQEYVRYVIFGTSAIYDSYYSYCEITYDWDYERGTAWCWSDMSAQIVRIGPFYNGSLHGGEVAHITFEGNDTLVIVPGIMGMMRVKLEKFKEE